MFFCYEEVYCHVWNALPHARLFRGVISIFPIAMLPPIQRRQLCPLPHCPRQTQGIFLSFGTCTGLRCNTVEPPDILVDASPWLMLQPPFAFLAWL